MVSWAPSSRPQVSYCIAQHSLIYVARFLAGQALGVS